MMQERTLPRHWVLGLLLVFGVMVFTACDNVTGFTGRAADNLGAGRGSEPVRDWGEWEIISLATCIAEGEERRRCRLNPSHAESRAIPVDPYAHELQGDFIPPCCTTPGGGKRYCALCDYYNDGYMPALGHLWHWAKLSVSTCIAAGMKEGTCQREGCGETYEREWAYVDPAAHLWCDDLITTHATCVKEGFGQRLCLLCDVFYDYAVIPINPNAHRMNWQLTTHPTCVRHGVETGTCEYCSATDTRDGAPPNPSAHNMALVTTSSATCVAPGVATLACQHEGCDVTETHIVAPINPNAHDMGWVTIREVGISTDGRVEYRCQREGCNHHEPEKTRIYHHTGTHGITFSRSAGQATVTGFTGMASEVVIPAYHNGLPVTSIRERAFHNNQLTSVTIPNSVTTIGAMAFQDNELTSVTIPNSVTTIGAMAFQDNELTSVTIPNSVTTIEYQTFFLNQLTSVTIPDSVTTIGDNAFLANQLTSVTIPNSVTTIGRSAFRHNQLTSVYITNGVTAIGSGAFAYNELTSVTIPNSVTTIEPGAFQRNQLTSVYIPNSVTTIESGAFQHNQLTSVYIPNTVTTIEGSAFWGNRLTSVYIPNSVTTIGGSAFGRNHLTSVYIPNSVTIIGNSAFRENQLTSVTIPNSVTTIGVYVFAFNPLNRVNLPFATLAAADSRWGGTAWRTGFLVGGVIPEIAFFFESPIDPRPQMVRVEAGSFYMGRELGDADIGDVPNWHRVTLTSGFYMGRYPVTQAQFYEVMRHNPSAHRIGGERASNVAGLDTENHPVEMVSWYEAIVFSNRLSMMSGLTPAYEIHLIANPSVWSPYPADWGSIPTSNNTRWDAVRIVPGSTGYRLPTEAQWEFAAKGGITGERFTFAGSNIPGEVARYVGNSQNRTWPVGTLARNGLGLHDMSGNVREWVWDWFDSFPSGPQTDPTGPSWRGRRVLRSGGWYDAASESRSVNRIPFVPYRGHINHGFRVVRPLH